jgi:hypothetical protein
MSIRVPYLTQDAIKGYPRKVNKIISSANLAKSDRTKFDAKHPNSTAYHPIQGTASQA